MRENFEAGIEKQKISNWQSKRAKAFGLESYSAWSLVVSWHFFALENLKNFHVLI